MAELTEVVALVAACALLQCRSAAFEGVADAPNPDCGSVSSASWYIKLLALLTPQLANASIHRSISSELSAARINLCTTVVVRLEYRLRRGEAGKPEPESRREEACGSESSISTRSSRNACGWALRGDLGSPILAPFNENCCLGMIVSRPMVSLT